MTDTTPYTPTEDLERAQAATNQAAAIGDTATTLADHAPTNHIEAAWRTVRRRADELGTCLDVALQVSYDYINGDEPPPEMVPELMPELPELPL